MKSMFIVALALVAVAAAAPADEPTQILQYENVQQPDGSYRFSYETSDGSQRQEEGKVKEVLDEENKPHNVVVVRGSFRYVDGAGKPVEVVYGADDKGYTAEGESIPKPVSQ